MKKYDAIDELDKNLKRCHSPLSELDSADKTFGCRHSNPDSCSKCYTECCAFFREDKFCTRPPKPWRTKFDDLKAATITKNASDSKKETTSNPTLTPAKADS